MKKYLIIYLTGISLISACNSNDICKDENCKKDNVQIITHKDTMDNNGAIAKNSDQEISCKLTTPELSKRKETVIASLKAQILEKKEFPNGYSYKFAGTDAIVDELAEFVKSERSCCSFFTFGLSFSGDGTEAWLNLTGPEGAKEMIKEELGM